jgi:PAS domain S-box-containing protein
MDVKIILTLSVALQYVAAAMTLRLVRTSTARLGWLAIFVAIGLMAARRTITLYHTFDGAVTPDGSAEIIALLTSILMLVGIATIGPLFNAVAVSERALRAEKSRAQTYLDVVGVMMVAIDRDGHITLANRKACEMLGYDEESLVGRDWFDTGRPPQVRKEARDLFDEIMNDDTSLSENSEGAIVTCSGETRVIAWHNALLCDSEGNITGLLGSGLDITDRQLAEEKLRKSDERYKLAIAGTTDGLWDWDLQTNEVHYSPRFKELLGYEGSEFDHTLDAWANLLHPDDRERIFQAVAFHHKHRSPYDVEYRLKTKSGDYRWFRARGKSIWDADGQPTRMAGSTQDITEQKQAEMNTRESEERFRQVAENITEVFWLTDWKTKQLLYVSPNYEKVFGRTEESLRLNRRSWLTALVPEDRDRVGAAFKNAAEAGVFVEDEYRIAHPDGSHRWIRDRAYPVRNEAGEVYRIVGVAEDVTDRKIAQREQVEASARMNAIFTSIADCIILIDEEGIIESLNHSALELFGYDADEIVGKNVTRLMPAPFRHEHDDHISDYLRTGIRKVIGQRREVAGCRKDGSTFPLELHVSEINLNDRRIYCGVVTDLTNRREADELIAKHNAELAHVARLSTMGEMAAGLAHEVSQPLTAVVNYTAGSYRHLRDGAPVTPELIDALDRAASQARRAGEIIHRLYDFAQKREPRSDRVNLSALISEVIQLLAAELRSAGVNIERNVGVDLPIVLGDSVQLQQVMINLMMNSIEAMIETPVGKRRMSISAAAISSTEVRVSVSDRGHGLGPDAQQNIFDQFHTTKEDGLGMGLSISRTIIESHGGLLTATNNDSRGATFSFTLPCHDGKESK